MNVVTGGGKDRGGREVCVWGGDLEVSHRENCFGQQAAGSAKTIFLFFS